MVKGLSHLAPHAHVLFLKNADFSRDPQAVKAMDDDPLIAHEAQPTKTVAELVRADERLKREFPLITLPVLILHGTADKVTRPSGSQLFYDTAGSTDKTLTKATSTTCSTTSTASSSWPTSGGGSRRGSPRRKPGPAPGLLAFGLLRQLLREIYATWPGRRLPQAPRPAVHEASADAPLEPAADDAAVRS